MRICTKKYLFTVSAIQISILNIFGIKKLDISVSPKMRFALTTFFLSFSYVSLTVQMSLELSI